MELQIQVEAKSSHLEMVITAETVTVPVMREGIDVLIAALRTYPREKVLMEVVAPDCAVGLVARAEVWTYALQKGLMGLKIAHVITGRNITDDERFKENFANNRGIWIQTFRNRAEALAWLNPGSELHGDEVLILPSPVGIG